MEKDQQKWFITILRTITKTITKTTSDYLLT